jgi:hypothetical protein
MTSFGSSPDALPERYRCYFALPALTASYSGLVNGDTAASLATQPTLDAAD